MKRILPLLLVLSACGESRPTANEAEVELPQPSGPPVVQQAEPEKDKPAAVTPAVVTPGAVDGWSSEGGALRLMQDGKTLLTLSCASGTLTVRAPGFTPIGSEDRFALGLGQEPVTLVADPTRQSGPGVTAEGPAPADFAERLASAGPVTALYGTQQVGPHPAPSAQAAAAIAANCA